MNYLNESDWDDFEAVHPEAYAYAYYLSCLRELKYLNSKMPHAIIDMERIKYCEKEIRKYESDISVKNSSASIGGSCQQEEAFEPS